MCSLCTPPTSVHNQSNITCSAFPHPVPPHLIRSRHRVHMAQPEVTTKIQRHYEDETRNETYIN